MMRFGVEKTHAHDGITQLVSWLAPKNVGMTKMARSKDEMRVLVFPQARIPQF
jgi:hypothetical protein